MKYIFTCLFGIITLSCLAQPGSSRPIPSKEQLSWQSMEFYLFVHFGPNTFTGKEWGEGNEKEDIFDPSNLDCRQWCRVAKAAGAKGIIITAKHHDGFCLWPSHYSNHTIAQSKWRNGKGDILRELSTACKEYGLKFGVYISPWDRNHPKYGTRAYNDVFVNMMKEIFTNYGPVWELWWDGANGEGPNGKKQVYDWDRFKKTVRSLSPHTVIFSDVGPDIRWCGNEKGIAGKTNWNYLDTAGFTPGPGAPPVDTLNQGNINGKAFIPSECDVSIRPGWFYHPEEDDKIKSPEQLFQLYLQSVGRGSNLLLNVPPDRHGLISKNDSTVLVKFKELRDESFGKNLLNQAKIFGRGIDGWLETHSLTDHDSKTAEWVVDFHPIVLISFKTPQDINCISMQEPLIKGQSIERFKVELITQTGDSVLLEGTTVGKKRILTFPRQKVKTICLTVSDTRAFTGIDEMGAYLIDDNLIEK